MTTTTMANPTGLSGWDATAALARLAMRRVVRGKALWFAIALGLLPCALALIFKLNDRDPINGWGDLVDAFVPLLAIVPPILVASSLSDEIDDKTSSYLWSRALPRWTVVTGKLLGLIPVAALSIVLGITIAWLILGTSGAVPTGMFVRTVLAVAAGAAASSTVSAMWATLFPRFAVPIAVGWLLLDTVIGALDMNIHVIAVTFGPRAFIDLEHTLAGAISLVVLTAIALAVAVWRVDRIE